MKEDGSVKTIEEEIPEDHKSIAKMIRYSPRQVTIPPRGSQIIRLMLRKKSGTKDGEYRSNVVFRNVPKDVGENLDKAITKEGEVGVKITPIFGISIPVIVRQGELNATPSLSDMKLTKDKDGFQKVELKLHRKGNRSVYGHFKVNYTPPSDDKPIQVGVIKGIAAYNNIESRPVEINLNVPEGVTLKKGGTLKVSFEEDRDMGGDATAEQSITIL